MPPRGKRGGATERSRTYLPNAHLLEVVFATFSDRPGPPSSAGRWRPTFLPYPLSPYTAPADDYIGWGDPTSPPPQPKPTHPNVSLLNFYWLMTKSFPRIHYILPTVIPSPHNDCHDKLNHSTSKLTSLLLVATDAGVGGAGASPTNQFRF